MLKDKNEKIIKQIIKKKLYKKSKNEKYKNLEFGHRRERFSEGQSFVYAIAQNNNFVQKGIGVKYRIPGSGIPFKS